MLALLHKKLSKKNYLFVNQKILLKFLKGKTTEKLGVVGKEKAIACEVICSVIKYD